MSYIKQAQKSLTQCSKLKKNCLMFFQVPLCNDDDKGVILAPFSINEEEKSDYGTSSKLQAVQSELCMPIVKSWNFWSCQTIVQKVCKGSDTHYLLPGVYLIFPRRALLDLIEQNWLQSFPKKTSAYNIFLRFC